MDISSLFNRCNVITDRYFERSSKERTREGRGSGTGLIVTLDDCSEIPPNFISKFLSNVLNKADFNKYVANKFLTYHEGKQSILCVTSGDSIISNCKAVLSVTEIINAAVKKPIQGLFAMLFIKDIHQKERIYQCKSKKKLIAA